MNNYIILDGKRYRTSNRSWRHNEDTPSSDRILLDGRLDATWGAASLHVWTGEIVGPVTPDGAEWGTVADLRTSLAKRQFLSFQDHYGDAYTVKATGPFAERSLSPRWSSPSNTIYISATLKAVIS